ncbi:hypothetical protein [Nostoc sp.]|nr:hypothetical protein [Nostoc sp.]
MIQLYPPQQRIDRSCNRYRLLDVAFLVVRGDTNLNNERRTNNHS